MFNVQSYPSQSYAYFAVFTTQVQIYRCVWEPTGPVISDMPFYNW